MVLGNEPRITCGRECVCSSGEPDKLGSSVLPFWRSLEAFERESAESLASVSRGTILELRDHVHVEICHGSAEVAAAGTRTRMRPLTPRRRSRAGARR
ncbi:hypothetical protein AXG93_163s1040 [Marchantia polymorpha subsp. ruderalis]|uniref:Uncharacterized protein n=1 Tax=Marchantia polymorpha subsp. ruderalis TaxID=1480154 RepID=A0A176VC88_MARPO|nr:hypothetical protein AXG93_163s1040 [Marchantia polymorpha subsp. ruderalis]